MDKNNELTEEVKKIALSANNDKRIRSVDSIETYAYGTTKDLECKKDDIKCKNTTKQHKNDEL